MNPIFGKQTSKFSQGLSGWTNPICRNFGRGAIDSCLQALAMALVTKGRPDQAEARFKKAIKIQPHYYFPRY